MKALEFTIWLRDTIGVIRHSREGDKLKSPSNGELRRWISNGCIQVSRRSLTLQDTVEWPIESLILFPNGRRVTIV